MATDDDDHDDGNDNGNGTDTGNGDGDLLNTLWIPKLHECIFPPQDFAGPSHNDCRSHGFLFDAQPESEKTFHIQMVFLILPH